MGEVLDTTGAPPKIPLFKRGYPGDLRSSKGSYRGPRAILGFSRKSRGSDLVRVFLSQRPDCTVVISAKRWTMTGSRRYMRAFH